MKQCSIFNNQIYEFILNVLFILLLSADIAKSVCIVNNGFISVEPNSSFVQCCQGYKNETLQITGENVRTLSINLHKHSLCNESFNTMIIMDTSIRYFNFTNITGLRQIKRLKFINNLLLERIDNLTEYFPNIEELEIKNSAMRILTKNSISNLSKLKILNIIDNKKLATIENGAFNGLTGLKDFRIINNFITNILPSVFKDAGKSLQVLISIRNPIHSQIYKEELFQYLPNLAVLVINLGYNTISNNGPYSKAGIKNLTDRVLFNLKKLKELDLSYLKIENLYKLSFYGLHNVLKTLKLNANKIRVIPTGTFTVLSSLEILNLSYNMIRCISAESVGGLKNLRLLDLSGNKIDYISTLAMKELTGLKTLNLKYNKLFVIESNAFGYFKLEKLEINLIDGRARMELKGIMSRVSNITQINGLEDYSITYGGNQNLINQTTGVTNATQCPTAKPKDKLPNGDRSYGPNRSDGSRKYLLIIIGICVLFLLVALAIIMTYRAWSKRRSEQAAMLANDQELKQLQTQPNANSSNLKPENIPLTSDVPTTTVVNNNGKRPISINNIDDEGTYLTPLGVL